jgi:hypothetical protein
MLKCVLLAAEEHVSLLKTLNSVQTWSFCRTCIRIFYFSCIFSLEIPEYRNFLIFPHMTCVFFFLKNHYINISVKFGSYPRITLYICVLVCVCEYMYAYINTHIHIHLCREVGISSNVTWLRNGTSVFTSGPTFHLLSLSKYYPRILIRLVWFPWISGIILRKEGLR